MTKLGAFTILAGLAIAAPPEIAMAGSDGSEAAGMMSESMMFSTMDPVKGRKLFASKGCVVCHAVNGIGGEDAPPLDAADMPSPMNPFDFAAKMWMGAGAMIMMQEDELGEQIEFTGEELANIIAFVHDAEEQKKFSPADIPQRITKLMDRAEKESD